MKDDMDIIRRVLMLPVIVLVCIFLSSIMSIVQAQEKQEVFAKDLKTESGASELKNDFNLNKDRYQKRIEATIRSFQTRAKYLSERSANEGRRAKDMLIASADKIKKKSEIVKGKLSALKAAGSDKWYSLKNEIDLIILDIEKTYDKTVSKIKKTDSTTDYKEDE